MITIVLIGGAAVLVLMGIVIYLTAGKKHETVHSDQNRAAGSGKYKSRATGRGDD